MRVRILKSAFNDLDSGRVFYEKQGEGVGDYFFNSVSSDIDSLAPCRRSGLKFALLRCGVSPAAKRATIGRDAD